jgi:hypothetical protein
MNTSFLLIALASVCGPVVPPEGPSWVGDYRSARRVGQSEHKPLAVFLGSGPDGLPRLGEEAKRILATEYVCVYVDTAAAPGKRLAADFEFPAGRGVVLSDRACAKQAFRHAGALGDADLARSLRRYADPDRVVRRTETSGASRAKSPARRPHPSARAPLSSPPPLSYGFPSVGGGGC